MYSVRVHPLLYRKIHSTPTSLFSTLIELLSTFFALQSSISSSENLKQSTREALLLHSTLRMIRDNLRMSTYILQEEDANGISIVALCSLSRAAAILVRRYRGELSSHDLEMVRCNLKRFSARWAVCGEHGRTFEVHELIGNRELSELYR